MAPLSLLSRSQCRTSTTIAGENEMGNTAGFQHRVTVSFLGLLLVVASGCPSSPEPKPAESDGKTAGSNRSAGGRQCAEQFENSYRLMRPESLGIEADTKTANLLLNEWYFSCGQKPEAADIKAASETIAEFLADPGTVKTRLGADRFDGRDVAHIRTSILCREIVEHATSGMRTDLGRAESLFDYTVRNVSIAPNVAARVPRTVFEILLFGLGGHNDRVWVFANLMRQLRIDVVAILPNDSQSGDGSPVLAGVVLDGNMYLFDPQRGIAIPSSVADSESPATWDEFISGKVTVEGFDPAAGIPRVLGIGNTSLWSPRMSSVQKQLVGDKSFVVFADIGSSSANNGTLARIRDVINQPKSPSEGSTPAETLEIWSYPEERIKQFENPTEQEQQIVSVMMAPFDTTSTTSKTNRDQQNQATVSTRQERRFRMARLSQLLGDYDDEALPSYLKLRLQSARELAAARGINNGAIQLYRVIGEDAHYWTGLCQLEKKQYRQCIDTMSAYVKKFDNRQPGNSASLFRWGSSAITTLAICLAETGEFEQAVNVLALMPDSDPEPIRTAYLKSLWSKQVEPKDESPKDESPKDESPKDESPKDESPKDESDKDVGRGE